MSGSDIRKFMNLMETHSYQSGSRRLNESDIDGYMDMADELFSGGNAPDTGVKEDTHYWFDDAKAYIVWTKIEDCNNIPDAAIAQVDAMIAKIPGHDNPDAETFKDVWSEFADGLNPDGTSIPKAPFYMYAVVVPDPYGEDDE